MDGQTNRPWWEKFLKAPTPEQNQPSIVRGMTGATSGLGGYNPVTGQTMVSQRAPGMGATTPSGQFTGLGGFKPTAQQTPNLTTALQGGTVTPTAPVPTTTETSTTGTGINFNALFANYLQQGMDATAAARTASQQVAENTYQAQLAAGRTQAERNRLATQAARQQISEQDFLQQRALMQGAAARGLGGSGVEQLARTQARMQTGQNVNQLAQQEQLANQELRDYVAQVEAKRGEALTNSELNYKQGLLNLLGNNIEQLKFLDSKEYRDQVFAWQKDNAAQEAARLNLKDRQDLLLLLNSPDIDDYTKQAYTNLMVQANILSKDEASKLYQDTIGLKAGEAVIRDTFDWATPLTVASQSAATTFAATGNPFAASMGFLGGLVTGSAAELATGAFNDITGQSLTATYNFSDPTTGQRWTGTGAQAIDKNNSGSLIYRYRNRAAYDAVSPFIEGGVIKYRLGNQTFRTFNEAENAWLATQQG